MLNRILVFRGFVLFPSLCSFYLLPAKKNHHYMCVCNGFNFTNVIRFSRNFSLFLHHFQPTRCVANSCLFLISLFGFLALLCITFIDPNPHGFDLAENGRLFHSRKDVDACFWTLLGVFQPTSPVVSILNLIVN